MSPPGIRVTILGAGTWGSTFAVQLGRKQPVTLWARRPEQAEEINRSHRNRRYLAEYRLPESIRASSEIAEAVGGCDLLIVAVPSHAVRQALVASRPHLRPWVPVISLSKGLETDTQLRMTEVIDEVLPGHPSGLLTGPNLASEILDGYAAASVLAMQDPAVLPRLRQLFSSGLFRVYSNSDMIGCEFGGVLKNIIAIGCGISDGMGAGDNTRAAIITRGLAEITRLGVALGGRAESFAGLAGMGDLVASCTSPLSRNHAVGVQLGRGQQIDAIEESLLRAAEGINTSRVALALAQRHGVEAPMTQQIYEVCHCGRSARSVFRQLLKISAGAEDEPG